MSNGHDAEHFEQFPSDPTEATRRAMIAEQRIVGPLTREQLAAVHGEVFDTAEMSARYRVKAFMAPFVVVEEHGPNGRLGTLEFQHSPRFYYGFTPDKD